MPGPGTTPSPRTTAVRSTVDRRPRRLGLPPAGMAAAAVAVAGVPRKDGRRRSAASAEILASTACLARVFRFLIMVGRCLDPYFLASADSLVLFVKQCVWLGWFHVKPCWVLALSLISLGSVAGKGAASQPVGVEEYEEMFKTHKQTQRLAVIQAIRSRKLATTYV